MENQNIKASDNNMSNKQFKLSYLISEFSKFPRKADKKYNDC